MPNYRLTYFNAKGRAEVTRYLFALADVKYDDVRLPYEEWAKLKPSSNAPFGQLPILEVDGNVLCQSSAVAGYVARELGYHAKNNIEEYTISMLWGAVDDKFQKTINMHTEKDEAKKTELTKEFHEFLPKWLGALEKILQENGGKHFVGNRLTVGDIAFFYSLEYLKARNENVLQKTPGLAALWDAVAANPKIAAWRANRPKTEY